MRVIVCGGRNYFNKGLVFRTLDSLNITFLVEGGATGADDLAHQWALSRLGLENMKTVPANWPAHRLSAGPRRNRKMLLEESPDMVIAFPGGPGTADMVKIARRAGVTVLMVTDDK